MVKPIIFNTEMVRALLEGWKTETRRIIKPSQLQVLESPYRREHPELGDRALISALCLPPFEVGDVLYVREAWQYAPDQQGYVYRADGLVSERLGDVTFKWRPSIHMPRQAARIFLEVTGVRPERLQEITWTGCLREGVEPDAAVAGAAFVWGMFQDIWDGTMNAVKRTRYGWDANPWVWVIAFRPCERPEGWA